MISMFEIVALTPKGELCLQKNLDEFKKLPPQTKLMWKALFSREVMHDPLMLQVKVKNSHLSSMLNPSDLIKKLVESMKNEGASLKVDYKIKVYESNVLRRAR